MSTDLALGTTVRVTTRTGGYIGTVSGRDAFGFLTVEAFDGRRKVRHDDTVDVLTVIPEAQACEGCTAEACEPCDVDCLSHVTY